MEALSAFLSRFADEFWHILIESGVWLLFGLIFAGLIHAFVPRSWFTKHLAGKGVAPILKASLLGIPMPLCSCSVIPVAAGLRRQGAGRGASAAFAISTPQTGEESIPLTWALFGPVFALSRPVIAVVTGFVAGLLIDLTGPKDRDASEPSTHDDDDLTDPNAIPLGLSTLNAPPPAQTPTPPAAKSCCSSEPKPAAKSCCSSEAEPAAKSCCSTETPAPDTHPGLTDKLRTAWHHGFVTMLRDLAPWLTVGLVLAGVIGASVPEGWIAQNVGTGILPKLAMLLVGIPLYICATSSTPLAWSLVAAGLSPGAAIVLLLSGPATNVATMAWVVKDLGVRALVVYLTVIAALSLAAGIAFDAFFSGAIRLAETTAEAHAHGPLPHTAWGWTQFVAAGLFGLMLLWALAARYWPKRSKPAASCCSSGATAEPHAHHHGHQANQEPKPSCGTSCGCEAKA